ncbi:MAG: NAD(P)H-dependent oxidoreductase [Huintestinicola sp.]
MKIVVLTGSPRKNGNSNLMADAFIKAAEEKGHNIVRFDTAQMNVSGCRACQSCFRTGRACSYEDDFNIMAPDIETADGVVFIMPVYWYSIPAQLKAVMDKFYSFMIGEKDIAGKQCALIVCAADDDTNTFDGVRFTYEKSIELMKWTSVGEVFIAGVNNEGEVLNTNGAQRVASLAAKFGSDASAVIDKNMSMGEILSVDAGIAYILMQSGMHCVGCPSSVNETLAEACDVHGISCDALLTDINEYLSKKK